MSQSAGILMYRVGTSIEVLLVHPGGPFWVGKDDGAWSIPKGEFDPTTEDAYAAACREFREELGIEVPDGEPIDLGEIVQRAGKVVHAFALEGELDPAVIVSNTFEIEWPPRSGRRQEVPEVDRAEWFELADAGIRINPAQADLIDRLLVLL
jgi:predicted NUDIX family NTP pyrophosphohydrolase